jgi:hypothetical protein
MKTVKEKPILFSTPMVKAILEGRKTMTRRVIQPQPDKDAPCIAYSTIEGFQTAPEQADEIWAQTEEGQSVQLKPLCKRGDILWVKETWCALTPEHIIEGSYVYKADADTDTERIRKEYIQRGYPYQWKSPRFMPREAVRLFLEVKAVRIERLRDITEEDAKAEGVQNDFTSSMKPPPHGTGG